MTTEEIEKLIGRATGSPSAKRKLDELCNAGVLMRVGTGTNAKYIINTSAVQRGISGAAKPERPRTRHDSITHFSISTRSREELEEMLERLKSMGWVVSDVTSEDWIFRLTGLQPSKSDWTPSSAPIRFSQINQCRYFVKKYLFVGKKVTDEQWQTVMRVFTADNGDIKNVKNATKTPSGANELDDLLG